MVLWTPSADYIEKSEMTRFKEFAEKKHNRIFEDYQQLWQWSIDKPGPFWEDILQYFKVDYDGDYESVLNWSDKDDFIGAKWFDGIKLSYGEYIFSQYTDERPAIVFKDEKSGVREVSWKELRNQVNALRQFLIGEGIGKGDTVAGILNNTPETIAIFLAVNSLGAIWSCCSPDFGEDSIMDRFSQIEPKILFADVSYHYNGKVHNKSKLIDELAEKIDSIEDVLVVNDLKWRSIMLIAHQNTQLTFERVEFDHPIWILYSSGTTGKPKAITHSTGGNLLEHLKALALHQNVQAGERFMWYSTTGWMMWNYALASLAAGATLCIYDGSLSYPNLNVGWEFALNNKIDHFGVGAPFYIACAKADLELPEIPFKTIGSTGSPLPPETFEWLQDKFKDTQIISLSGGTDVCSAFFSGCPWLPVHSGELQSIALGADIEALNDIGEAVEQELGELVINQPMPSMPVYFWNDEGDKRYRSSYFENYKGRWYHGDWIKITENKGIIIFGRSDATLNRGGVRIGTAEIYNGIQNIKGIQDSLVVSLEKEDGSSEMQLFLKLADGVELNDALLGQIKDSLRKKHSPRHVPDKIVSVPDIPYTFSGKKLELPIKRILMGMPVDKAVSFDAVKNPESLDFWIKNRV